jgi:hypothetical protein
MSESRTGSTKDLNTQSRQSDRQIVAKQCDELGRTCALVVGGYSLCTPTALQTV